MAVVSVLVMSAVCAAARLNHPAGAQEAGLQVVALVARVSGPGVVGLYHVVNTGQFAAAPAVRLQVAVWAAVEILAPARSLEPLAPRTRSFLMPPTPGL